MRNPFVTNGYAGAEYFCDRKSRLTWPECLFGAWDSVHSTIRKSQRNKRWPIPQTTQTQFGQQRQFCIEGFVGKGFHHGWQGSLFGIWPVLPLVAEIQRVDLGNGRVTAPRQPYRYKKTGKYHTPRSLLTTTLQLLFCQFVGASPFLTIFLRQECRNS